MLKSLNIKQAIAFGYLCLIIAGCSPYTPYRYSFSLIEPQNETMSFEDENVQFRFVPSPENIQVAIRNKTDHKINLVRDNAEYMDYLGESRRIHYGYDYVQEVRNFEYNNLYVPPITVDPDSEISGYVWVNIWPDFCIGQDRHSITTDQINYLVDPEKTLNPL